MCLPAGQIVNETVACLRPSSDKFQYFQTNRFHCSNDTKCTADKNLCNKNQVCSAYNNYQFCVDRLQLCNGYALDNLRDMRDISCRIINTAYKYFSLDTALVYPVSQTTQTYSLENQVTNKKIELSIRNIIQPYACNYGLYMYHRLGIDNYSSLCFCPQNYYGDRCQYQSQRVSLTLTLVTVRLPIIYAIAVMLIEDDKDRQEIHSYNQFTYAPLEHCGTCMKYHNEERFFCQCYSGWSGAQCHIPIDCSMCASNSICVGSIRNRSICVCPHGKFGSFCRLQLVCPIGFCKNNGRCIVIDERMIHESYMCFCSEQFFGPRCENVKHRIDISLENIETPLYLLVYIYTEISFERSPPTFVILRKMTMFQSNITLYSQTPFQMVIVKIDDCYYLAVLLRKFVSSNIITPINPAQRCVPVHELLPTKLLILPRIQRLKSYHIPCQDHVNLQCFVDEFYMCLCTEERHSNCFPLEHQQTFACDDNVYCENGGTCLQDRRICFYNILCVCNDCFFGDRCQFYAKGIGLTLDDLLRYEIRPNNTLADQSLVVKLSAASTIIIFLIGLLNSFFGYLVFHNRNCRKVASGIYLRLSSVISTLVVSMLIIRFWFVTYTYMNPSINRKILQIGCLLLEPMLRFFLHM
ncbi:unnamed protein product, partial [Adineta steineri]